MQVKTKTVEEIVDETAAAYKHNTRALVGAACTYFDPSSGAKCAVGRCLKNPKKYEGSSLIVRNAWTNEKSFQRELLPEYRGHSMAFWEALQRLHDNSMFWDMRGLTRRGKVYAKTIKTTFGSRGKNDSKERS